jgi:hypothetical protein
MALDRSRPSDAASGRWRIGSLDARVNRQKAGVLANRRLRAYVGHPGDTAGHDLSRGTDEPQRSVREPHPGQECEPPRIGVKRAKQGL